MISDLNTIIQFLAAIYLTITIDSIMFRRFWTPNLYSIIEDKLNEYSFALSSPLKKELLDSIKSNAHIVDSNARKRGGYMLAICVMALIFASFETEQTDANIYFVYSITLIAAALFFIGGVFKWKKWRRVIYSLLCVIALYGVSIITFNRTSLSANCYIYCSQHQFLVTLFPKVATIILLIIPIIGRLYLNWLYSTVYIHSLSNALNEEKLKYDRTKEGIDTGDKDKCDDSYKQAFIDVFFDKTGKQDQINTKLANTLKEHLVNICVFKKWYEMVCYSFSKKYRNRDVNSAINAPTQTSYTLPATKVDESNFPALLKDYNERKLAIKIVDFCKEKGIDPEAFKKYRRDHK